MAEDNGVGNFETSYVYRIPERPWRSRSGGPLVGVRRLQSLKEHNDHAYMSYMKSAEACPNEISCPECGKELWDTTPMLTLTSYPPKMNIHCRACDYRGYRLA